MPRDPRSLVESGFHLFSFLKTDLSAVVPVSPPVAIAANLTSLQISQLMTCDLSTLLNVQELTHFCVHALIPWSDLPFEEIVWIVQVSDDWLR